MERWEPLLHRLEQFMDRADSLLDRVAPRPADDPSLFERFCAFRWERWPPLMNQN